MAKGKPPFAPAPARAMRPLTYWNKERERHEELTALDLRVLMCIGWHDRLSTSKGSPGCYASNELMAAEVGCTMQSLSRSISHLIDAGLISRDRNGVPGKRHLTVYRVIYDPADVALLELFNQRDKRSPASDDKSFTRDDAGEPETVTRGREKSAANSTGSLSQETSLREGIDSSEDEEKNSSEDARFAARRASRLEFADNVGGQLSRFERDWRARPNAYEVCKLEQWSTFCEQVQETYELGDPEYGQAQRLADEIDFAIDELRNGQPRPAWANA